MTNILAPVLLGMGLLAAIVAVTKSAAAAEAPAPAADASVKFLKDADFGKSAYSDKGPVLIDFTASWCPPCKRLAPIIDELAADYAGKMKVYKIDVDTEKQLVRDYKVTGYPTLVLLLTDANGKRVYVTSVGLKSKDELKKWIDNAIKNPSGTEAPKAR